MSPIKKNSKDAFTCSSPPLAVIDVSPQDQVKDNLFLSENAAVGCSLSALDDIDKLCFTDVYVAT